MNERAQDSPERIAEEYLSGIRFKQGLGDHGMYDQNRMNERFYVGDQWYGANCGNDRPLVRHNVIKRIGDYKMAVVGSNPVAVNYSAEGVPSTIDTKERVRKMRDDMASGLAEGYIPDEEVAGSEEINLVMSALSDYFRVTAERVKFDDLKELALRNSYQSGTGVLYTYWDKRIRTGLYSDAQRRSPISGDIACEVLDVENVYFGDPNMDSVQDQPYILIAQRKSVSSIRAEAREDGIPETDILKIVPDRDTGNMAGERSQQEPEDSKKATVLTKFWKEWDKKAQTYSIKAVRVCGGVTVRKKWDMSIRLYPLAKFSWERRRNCAYGESEITYLIPNQIAINRMITASVWAVMMMGMPIMVVNGDSVPGEITNDPGQILRVYGDQNDVAGSIRFVNPPNFSPNFDNNIASLISNTLTQAGANDAALGDMRPDNTSAIIAVREAATMPLQSVQNRYYSFCEDVARIWAEFWVVMYGDRSLKIEDETGTWYLPFKSERYKDLLISTRVDVGASTLWSESQSIRTLDNLFDRQVINVFQYLNRLPKGIVPDVNGLIRDLQAANQSISKETGVVNQPAEAQPETDVEGILSKLSPEHRALLESAPKQAQTALLNSALQAASPETMPTGTTL